MEDFISLEDCVPRHIYLLRSRNLVVGVFDVDAKGFIGIREKFGSKYLFTEYHWDSGPPFGTVRPEADLGVLPDHISVAERFGPFCVAHHLEWAWDAETKAGRHADGSSCERPDDGPSWDVIDNTALFTYLTPIDLEQKRLLEEEFNKNTEEA